MSDIFISYKREDQSTARKLANALESEGWTVWWDPKLRAGEHFDDEIEKALRSVKCVVVLWSDASVKSQYVRDEATYALEHKKLVPVAIEAVEMPFRFRGVQTPRLFAWDGSRDSSEFRKFADDISAILGDSTEIIPDLTKQTEEERLREQERQRSEEEARRKAENQRRIEEEANSARLPEQNRWERGQSRPPPSTRLIYVGGAVIVVIVIAVIALVMRRASENPAAEVFRDRLKSGGEGPEMVVVPAGSFQMGDIQRKGYPTEGPVRDVMIKRFAIGRYEVTFDEYQQFSGATGRQLPDNLAWGPGRPVMNVSWQDAVEYTKWLSEQTGKRYRLPTEAEWEYAARGGKETTYWWGNDFIKDMANCTVCENLWEKAAPVGSFKPNPFGLYDTSGNVWEWVQDCGHSNYNGAPPSVST